ncbi:MAG TPA: DUF5666 domain-containing protein [Solirubrobacteraceae bacterium]
MPRISLLIGLLAALTVALVPATAPARRGDGTKLEGRVLSVNRSARTFRLRDSERGTFTVHVTRSTRFERVAGFGALRSGRRIEVEIRRSGGRVMALKIEPGGSHG